MRVALLTPFVVAATFFACSTFSDAQQEAPPQSDAGPEGGGGETCTPVVVDPSQPQECTADFAKDPMNCGTCGHACVDSACDLGRCVAEKITDANVPVFAVDGTFVYGAFGNDIQRVDLTKRPLAFEPFFPSVFGQMTHLEVHAGELYVSTTEQPTIINLADKKQRGNEHFTRVTTQRGDGLFFPGRIAYYLYPGAASGSELARIDTTNGSVRYKKQSGFLPVARSGDELYWTESLTTGAQIWGAWDEEKEPIVRVGEPVTAFGADGEDVFLVGGGLVRRTRRNQPLVDLAKETGTAVAFAVSGNDVIYVVLRPGDLGAEHFQMYRVDKCRGGRPVLLFESINAAISRIALEGTSHVIVATKAGMFRVRR